MNIDELIEKCRLTDEEIEIASAVGREHYCRTHYLSKLPRFNDADKVRAAEREVAEAQLRKAIPTIEAEARKVERERIFLKLEEHAGLDYRGNSSITIGYNHGDNQCYYDWWLTLKGEGDV